MSVALPGAKNFEDLSLLVSLHAGGDRQGPGGDAETRRAIDLAGLNWDPALKIADIGCGTGASALVLAKVLGAQITAIDFLPDFLARLQERAGVLGLSGLIETHAQSMESLCLTDASLDAIWSEGAIYNIGFERGVKEWRRFLKPGGILAVSELTWLTDARPDELETHWVSQYPEVGKASEKMAVLEKNGYTPLGYFVLPEQCWLDAYYRPLQQRFASFLETHGSSQEARKIVTAEEHEIILYEQYRTFVSYGFYIAKKLTPPRNRSTPSTERPMLP